MGRCCAISGCKSGRKGGGKKALFKAPKNIDMLKKWSTAISQELKPTSYLCELHFNTDDVLRIDKQVLKDGNIFVYEYEKVHLKRTAVPQLNKNNAQNGDTSHQVSDIKIPEEIIDETTNTSTEDLVNFYDTTNDARVGDYETIVIDIPNSENIIPDNINESQEFSLDSLEKILQNQSLRQYWSWMAIKNSFISFSYINRKFELVCHCKIDINLKVTVINAKTNVSIDMEVIISSIDSVWQLLSSIERKCFCSGTGYDDKKCAPTCSGILSNEMYKRRMMEYRCISCRQLRRLIQKQKRNNTNHYKALWINTKHRLMLERRKLKRIVQCLEIA